MPAGILPYTAMLLIGLAATLTASSALAVDDERVPLTEPVSQSQLHTTWRNLANEQVLFPLDMKSMPVKIGHERQLFVDNYLIAEAGRVTRQVHPPKRHPENPILNRGDRSDGVIVLQVRRFDESPHFRMWYWSSRRWHTLASGQKIRFATAMPLPTTASAGPCPTSICTTSRAMWIATSCFLTA